LFGAAIQLVSKPGENPTVPPIENPTVATEPAAKSHHLVCKGSEPKNIDRLVGEAFKDG
jgi:hypothetical protein